MNGGADDSWKDDIAALGPADAPADIHLVMLEAFLDTGGEEREGLRDLLRLGSWPFDEVQRVIRGGLAGSAGKLRKLRDRRRREILTFPTAVILLPLRELHRDVYHWIVEPACHWESLRPLLIDREASGRRTVIGKAHDVMRAAELFVADVTGGNANVFYEIGFMEALDKPGVFVSLDAENIAHYVRGRQINEIRRGLEGMAAARRHVRAELRKIRRSSMRRIRDRLDRAPR